MFRVLQIKLHFLWSEQDGVTRNAFDSSHGELRSKRIFEIRRDAGLVAQAEGEHAIQFLDREVSGLFPAHYELGGFAERERERG